MFECVIVLSLEENESWGCWLKVLSATKSWPAWRLVSSCSVCFVVLSGHPVLTLPSETGHDESKDSSPREGEPTWATQEFWSLAKRRKGFLLSSPALFLKFLPRLSRKTNALLSLQELVTTRFPENNVRSSGFSMCFYLHILDILQWVCQPLWKCHKCRQHRWIFSHLWYFFASYK